MLLRMLIQNFKNGRVDEKTFNEVFSNYTEKINCDKTLCDNMLDVKRSIKFFLRICHQQRILKKLNDEFWANVFHDIKSPMMSINFALRPYIEENELFGDIYHLNATNLNFIQEILDAYNFQVGAYKREIEPVDLKLVLDEQILNNKFFLKEKGLTIEKKGFKGSFIVNYYAIGILRVFSNLIVNAIKFARENTVIEIEGKKTEEGILITFSNYGEKIIDGMEDEIFEKFKTATKLKIENSNGLGLFICRRLVNDAGGKIWAENFDDGVKISVLFMKQN